MAVVPVTLTVGDRAYHVGTVEVLAPGDAHWAQLERFLRAVADNLKDGYTLRLKAPTPVGCACPGDCEGGPECLDDEGGSLEPQQGDRSC
jgi:hypothetical protein